MLCDGLVFLVGGCCGVIGLFSLVVVLLEVSFGVLGFGILGYFWCMLLAVDFSVWLCN